MVAFQLDKLKVPGLDGFPEVFFQENWEVVKEEIVLLVKNFFDSVILPRGLNKTYIALVPKVQNPEKFTDFKPIS